MRHRSDEGRNRTQRSLAGKRFAMQALLFGVIFMGLAVFVKVSVSRNKKKTDVTVTSTIQQSVETMVVTETIREPLKEVKVDGVSLSGLNKKEAKEALLNYYSWNMRLNYKEQPILLSSPFPGMIDKLLEEIYSKNEAGEYTLDLAVAKENLRTQVKEAASKWNRKPVNAQLTGRDRDNNKWIYSDGENGIKIDEDKTVEKIMNLVNQKKFEEEVEAEALQQSPSLTASQIKE